MAKAAEAPVVDEGPKAPARVEVKAGSWVVFKDGRWFKGSDNDVNVRLSRSITKVGVALEAFGYEDGVGGDPHEAKTRTLRQFYQDAERPSLDLTESQLRAHLADLQKWQSLSVRRSVEEVLLPAYKKFARLYRGYAADSEKLGEPVYGAGALLDVEA